MTNNLTETTTSSATPIQEITLDTLKKTLKMINEAPPVPVKIKLSKDDFTFLKNNIEEEKPIIGFGGLVGSFGLAIEVDNLIEDGKAEISYSNGTIKIINLKATNNDK